MVSKRYSSDFKRVGGFLSMLVGGLLMAVLVISFTKGVEKKEVVIKKQTRIVAMKKRQPQVVKKTAQKTASQPKKTTAKAPPPNISAMIGGIAMNIPEFTTADITGDLKELLDDIVKSTVMSEGTVDRKPLVTNRPPMQYPENAAKEGVKGFVIVNLLIAKDGRVELAKIVESQPQGVFDNTVLSGVKDWLFSPARYKGEAVKVWAKQKVSFSS